MNWVGGKGGEGKGVGLRCRKKEESEGKGGGRKRRRKEKEAEKGGKLWENSFQFWCVPMIFMYCPKDYSRGYKGIFSYVPKLNFSVSQRYLLFTCTMSKWSLENPNDICYFNFYVPMGFNICPNCSLCVMSQWLCSSPNA